MVDGRVRPGVNAAELLIQRSFHSLPVVDEEGRLIGIVTASDLLRVFVQVMRAPPFLRSAYDAPEDDR